MILVGRKIELMPFFGDEDWQYAFELAKQYDPRLTHEAMVREVLREGFKFWVGYASGIRAGVVFSKYYRDGLSIDGYTDPKKLTKGQAVWYSLTSAHLVLENLLKHTDVVYARANRNSTELQRMCKVLGLAYDHEEKDRIVYSKRKHDYKAFNWESAKDYSFAENTR